MVKKSELKKLLNEIKTTDNKPTKTAKQEYNILQQEMKDFNIKYNIKKINVKPIQFYNTLIKLNHQLGIVDTIKPDLKNRSLIFNEIIQNQDKVELLFNSLETINKLFNLQSALDKPNNVKKQLINDVVEGAEQKAISKIKIKKAKPSKQDAIKQDFDNHNFDLYYLFSYDKPSFIAKGTILEDVLSQGKSFKYWLLTHKKNNIFDFENILNNKINKIATIQLNSYDDLLKFLTSF